MYLLIDEYGVIRGQTSDSALVFPLKDAIESIMQCCIYVAHKASCGRYVFGM